MNNFNIRDIENLCGIKAHTLRIWEQRYGLCVAKRKESRHRIYNDEDLKDLLRVSFLYHNGHKISKIAALGAVEINRLVENASHTDESVELYVHQLINAGIDLDKERFEKTVTCVVIRFGLEKAITHIFYPFLQRIGLLWMTNNVIPAQEHFVSHIIRKKIILATDGAEVDPESKAIVLIFAPRGELHEIPLLTINYFFRKYGTRTVYFGDNIPVDCIRQYLSENPVTHLFTHVTTDLNNDWLEKYICSLCKEFPAIKMVASGPACKCIQRTVPNLQVLQSMEEMISMARETGGAIWASRNS